MATLAVTLAMAPETARVSMFELEMPPRGAVADLDVSGVAVGEAVERADAAAYGGPHVRARRSFPVGGRACSVAAVMPWRARRSGSEVYRC
jgi:hypothetical protein